jgi:NADH:ubiquinone oxidoreductase subunit K
MFSITLSHFKKLQEVLHMMGAITIFLKRNVIFSFVGYGLVPMSFLKLSAHLKK